MVKTYKKDQTTASVGGPQVSHLARDSQVETREQVAHGADVLSASAPILSVTPVDDASEASLARRWGVQDSEYAAITGRATRRAHRYAKASGPAGEAPRPDGGRTLTGGRQSKPALKQATRPKSQEPAYPAAPPSSPVDNSAVVHDGNSMKALTWRNFQPGRIVETSSVDSYSRTTFSLPAA